jgi:ABC-type multidrug transport system fused ATPase/permease subunit
LVLAVLRDSQLGGTDTPAAQEKKSEKSGSGKTTISKLILGLYPTTDGKVSIDGQDINSILLRSLRSQIGVVDQDTFLFGGTIRENIAIARALLGNPQLLIFDEATSHLDAESERIIQNNLTNIRKNRTTIIIAHRLSTVRNFNLILVLDKGVLVEKGTLFSNLLK